MIYVLDAYNVIHKIARFEAALEKDLRASRDKLQEACIRLAAKRGDITQIVLVFDGKTEFRDLPRPALPKIGFEFSETGEDADEKIVSVIESLPAKTQKCIVSDDNSVRNHARTYKTNWMSVADFDQLLRSIESPKPKKTAGLSEKDARDITDSYKKALGID